MLFGTLVLPMVGLLATLAGWPLLRRQQPGRAAAQGEPVARDRSRAPW